MMKIMKTIKIMYWAAICLLPFACNESETDAVSGNPLTITASTEKVGLLEANENDVAVTFTWNSGIDRAPTDTIAYIFRMDIAGRDFATASPRDTVAGFTKSFTVSELNELITTQWQVYPGEEVDLEVRVVANVRGEKFVYPEIAVTKFSATTYSYASVPLYLAGSANPETAPAGLTETVNGRTYTWQGNLRTGGFKLLYSLQNALPSLNKGADNSTLVERTDASQPDDLFPVGNAGFYIVNVDRKNLKIDYRWIQYYFSEVYPIGSATSAEWNIGNLVVRWDDSNPGIYVYEGALKAGEFKIHTDKSWNGCFRPMTANASISGADVQYTNNVDEKGDLKWLVQSSEAGNYRITLDVSEMKIYFEKR
jgi:hypothetical protein